MNGVSVYPGRKTQNAPTWQVEKQASGRPFFDLPRCVPPPPTFPHEHLPLALPRLCVVAIASSSPGLLPYNILYSTTQLLRQTTTQLYTNQAHRFYFNYRSE